MNWIKSFDQQVVLAINSIHNPMLDEFMWAMSNKYTWIPLYLFILYLIWRKHNTKFLVQFFIIMVITIFIVDQISVLAFKEVFQRYRPSHHLELSKSLHYYTNEHGEAYVGGQYGFVSSHAANLIALLTLIYPIFKESTKWIIYIFLVVIILVMISRIYLGVHYLTDIVAGAGLGFLIASLVNKFVLKKIQS